jgi:hypothetical protein
MNIFEWPTDAPAALDTAFTTLEELEVRRREWEGQELVATSEHSPCRPRRSQYRAGGACEICHRQDSLQLHHMNYRSVGYELPSDFKQVALASHWHRGGSHGCMLRLTRAAANNRYVTDVCRS